MSQKLDSVQAVIAEMAVATHVDKSLADRWQRKLQAIIDSHKEPDAWVFPTENGFILSNTAPTYENHGWKAMIANPYELKP